MTEPASRDADEAERMLSLSERGLGAVQEVLAVLRDSDREVVRLLERVRRLEMLVWTDTVTGLLNQRGLHEEMNREEHRARRYGTPVALVLIEVLGLRAVSRDHGPAAAETVLRAVGSSLRVVARGSDIAARPRDDTFAALLPGADGDGARAFLTRLRAAATHVRLSDGAIISLELLTGFATQDEAGSLDAALDLAAERLLRQPPAAAP